MVSPELSAAVAQRAADALDHETAAAVFVENPAAQHDADGGSARIGEALGALAEIPPALLTLRSLELPLLSLLSLSGFGFLYMVFRRHRGRRIGYVAVDAVDRHDAADAAGFNLRHDTKGMWATGRRRHQSDKAVVEVETPGGKRWVSKKSIARMSAPES